MLDLRSLVGPQDRNQPVILCGLGRVGWRVLEFLKLAGLPVVVVDINADAADPRLEGAQLMRGDCRRREVLEQAGLAQARGVLVLTGDDLLNVSTALTIRQMNPAVRVVVRMFNQNLLARLGKAVTNVYALSVSALTAPLLALTALTGEALGTFGQGDDLRQVAELPVGERSVLRGQSITDAAARHRFQAIAHLPADAQAKFLLELDPEARLATGDRLIVCGEPDFLAPLLDPNAIADGRSARWGGTARRYGRVVGSTLGDVELAVKICGLVLLIVVAGSTLVYRLGMDKTIPDGLYRTISVIATGADMHEDELPIEWQKVFVSLLRMFGAAVTAAFTAIFTNYLLRSRLGKALEIRRIPDGGHVVVCGLGNVGFRVVEELIRLGEQVVVIERSPNNNFAPTARRLGVAYIDGDATVPEVLRQAQAGTAHAVLAVTDNELANLEIALLSRELNPAQRVVVRLADAQLATALREAANVRLALSTSALAAPAFFAALYGDRVQNIFLVGGQVLAVVELLVRADDPFLEGQAVRALAIDHRLLPVALVGADGTRRPEPRHQRLGAGDTLTAILTLPDLVSLLRRDRVPAEWAVDVSAFPIPTRGWVAGLLRTQRQLGAEEAEKALDDLPVCLGSCLTRGQAEDLLALCRRERVIATLRHEQEPAGA